MSDEDIRAGARWHPEITSNLKDCKVGIICLTRENKESRWIHFEAGALSKTVEKTYVCPLLIGELDKEDIPYPLAQFQIKKADRDGLFDIVKTINSVLDKTISLSEEMLKKSFDKWWPELEKVIQELPPVTTDKPKRNPDEMLEEILNSVRALSNMISERGTFYTSIPSISASLMSATPGISAGSTGPIESFFITEPVTRVFMKSEKPTEDNKKPEKPTEDKKKPE